MLKYILKRLAYAALILLGVSVIIYFLIRLMPVDYIQSKIDALSAGGATISQEMVENMYKMYGLQDTTGMGFMEKMSSYFSGYSSWLLAMLRGDLGTSFKYALPVADIIADKMWLSFTIALIATVFEFMIAIPLGITAATHQYSLRDYVVTILVMIGISLPSFFFGNILKSLFALKLGWFPVSGMQTAGAVLTGFDAVLDYLWHLVIPILTIVILSIGPRMRMTRTNMLEVMTSDYIRTARAKGLKESVVINKHAFRNTLIPLVTSMAGLLPGLFSGAIITEQIFGLEGIGNVALTAMNSGDIPFIMGYNMFLAVLSVVGVILADLAYAWVDPRVKLH
jgi:peptide/nickel transport system permease protein